MHGEGIHSTCECFPLGTIYGTVDDPGTPSVVAILGPGNHPQQQQVDVFPYLKTRHLCVLLHYLKLPLV